MIRFTISARLIFDQENEYFESPLFSDRNSNLNAPSRHFLLRTKSKLATTFLWLKGKLFYLQYAYSLHT